MFFRCNILFLFVILAIRIRVHILLESSKTVQPHWLTLTLRRCFNKDEGGAKTEENEHKFGCVPTGA